jgi:hypothetical protein
METAATRDEATDQTLEARPSAGPKGIGGWLILPFLHLVTTIVFTGLNIFPLLQDWFSLIGLLLDPVNRWMFLPIVISSVSAMAAILLAACALAMMFLKKRMLPWLMICFYSMMLLATLVDWVLFSQYPELREPYADDLGQARIDLVRAIVAAAIWIPYFLVSKRVKATFIE